MVRPGSQFAERMLGKECRGYGFTRYFPSGRFCTILAKLEHMRLGRLRPRAADAHETVMLVLFEQNFAAKNGDFLLREDLRNGVERAPSTSRRIVPLNLGFRSHGAFPTHAPTRNGVGISVQMTTAKRKRPVTYRK